MQSNVVHLERPSKIARFITEQNLILPINFPCQGFICRADNVRHLRRKTHCRRKINRARLGIITIGTDSG